MEIHRKLIIIYDTHDGSPAGRLQFRNALISRLGLSDVVVVSLLAHLPVGIQLDLSDEEGDRCVTALEQLGAEVEIISANIASHSAGLPICEEPELKHALTFLGQSGMPTEVLRAPDATVETLEQLLENAIHGSTEELAAALLAVAPEPSSTNTASASSHAPAAKPAIPNRLADVEEETLSLSSLSLDDSDDGSPAHDVSSLLLDSEVVESASTAPSYPAPAAPQKESAPGMLSFDALEEEITPPAPVPLTPQNGAAAAPVPSVMMEASAAEPISTADDAAHAESAAELPHEESYSSPEAPKELSAEQIQSAFARPALQQEGVEDGTSIDEQPLPPRSRLSKRMQLTVAAGCSGLLVLALGFMNGSAPRITFNLTDKTVEMLMNEQKRILNPNTDAGPAPRVVEATYSGTGYQAPFHSQLTVEKASRQFDAAKLSIRSDEPPRRTPLEIARNTRPAVWIRELVSDDLFIDPPVREGGPMSFAARGSARAYLSDELAQGRAKVDVEMLFTYDGKEIRGEWSLYNIPEAERAGRGAILERTGPSSYRISLRGTVSADLQEPGRPAARSIEELKSEIAANYLPPSLCAMVEQSEDAAANAAPQGVAHACPVE